MHNVRTGRHSHATEHMWKSEDNFMESVLSFYLYIGSRDQKHVAKPTDKVIFLSWNCILLNGENFI